MFKKVTNTVSSLMESKDIYPAFKYLVGFVYIGSSVSYYGSNRYTTYNFGVHRTDSVIKEKPEFYEDLNTMTMYHKVYYVDKSFNIETHALVNKEILELLNKCCSEAIPEVGKLLTPVRYNKKLDLEYSILPIGTVRERNVYYSEYDPSDQFGEYGIMKGHFSLHVVRTEIDIFGDKKSSSVVRIHKLAD